MIKFIGSLTKSHALLGTAFRRVAGSRSAADISSIVGTHRQSVADAYGSMSIRRFASWMQAVEPKMGWTVRSEGSNVIIEVDADPGDGHMPRIPAGLDLGSVTMDQLLEAVEIISSVTMEDGEYAEAADLAGICNFDDLDEALSAHWSEAEAALLELALVEIMDG